MTTNAQPASVPWPHNNPDLIAARLAPPTSKRQIDWSQPLRGDDAEWVRARSWLIAEAQAAGHMVTFAS